MNYFPAYNAKRAIKTSNACNTIDNKDSAYVCNSVFSTQTKKKFADSVETLLEFLIFIIVFPPLSKALLLSYISFNIGYLLNAIQAKQL